MPSKEHAIIIGVGPGPGRRVGGEPRARASRSAPARASRGALRALLDQRSLNDVAASACDVTRPEHVDDLFAAAISFTVRRRWWCSMPAALAAAASSISPPQVEAAWRVGCLGGFHVGQAAARAMVPQGRGSIIFTGATASLRGSANFAPFAMAKFGLRALAQSLARELGPKGIHVAHTIVDGQIGDDPNDAKLRPAEIADAYWHLHRQLRSAWTHELDLRPWAEKF